MATHVKRFYSKAGDLPHPWSYDVGYYRACQDFDRWKDAHPEFKVLSITPSQTFDSRAPFEWVAITIVYEGK